MIAHKRAIPDYRSADLADIVQKSESTVISHDGLALACANHSWMLRLYRVAPDPNEFILLTLDDPLVQP